MGPSFVWNMVFILKSMVLGLLSFPKFSSACQRMGVYVRICEPPGKPDSRNENLLFRKQIFWASNDKYVTCGFWRLVRLNETYFGCWAPLLKPIWPTGNRTILNKTENLGGAVIWIPIFLSAVVPKNCYMFKNKADKEHKWHKSPNRPLLAKLK